MLDSVEVWLDIGQEVRVCRYPGDSVLVRRHSWQASRDRMNTAPGTGRMVAFVSWVEDARYRRGGRRLLIRRQRLRPTEYRPDGRLVDLPDRRPDGGLKLVERSEPAHPFPAPLRAGGMLVIELFASGPVTRGAIAASSDCARARQQGGTLRTPDAPLADSALEVLALAREEASRLQHEYVGTEHVALALMRLREGTAARALDELALDRDAVRAMIASMVRPGSVAVAPSVALPYTSRTQAALDLAAEGAAALGHDSVGAEHLLLGLLREARGIGGQILLHHGLSAEAVVARLTAPRDAR